MALSVGCTEFIWDFECCSKKLRTPHHLSFLPRQVAGKVDLDAFLNALGAVGAPCVMRLGVVGMRQGSNDMCCIFCRKSSKTRAGAIHFGSAGIRRNYLPAKAQPADSHFLFLCFTNLRRIVFLLKAFGQSLIAQLKLGGHYKWTRLDCGSSSL